MSTEPDRANILIAGGGIIGTALAWALAKRGLNEIVVVDLDLSGLYASSELNAGGARATWWQPVNIATCAASLSFFRVHAEAFGFRERGYLWLYDDDALFSTAREKRHLQNEFGLEVELLTPREICERFPLLDRAMDEIVGATYSPHDGLLNPNAVRTWYRQEATALGVTLSSLNIEFAATVSSTALAPGRRFSPPSSAFSIRHRPCGGRSPCWAYIVTTPT